MKFKNICKRILPMALAAVMALALPVNVKADDPPDYDALAEARKALPIQSNAITDWPQGPEVSAEGAILIEAKTGAILYAKNIDERLYPASTTKILTCTLAMENCDLDEMITFSKEAINSVPWDGSKVGMDPGNSITMEQALEAILVGSANEVSNGVAEHVAGSMDEFVNMMNKRVEELGLENTHFANANGLYDDNHYTSAHDLAIIAKDFFSYEILCKLSRTPKVDFTPTATQPDEFTINSKNLLLPGKKYEYEYLVGSKTGYTDKARQTLVSCAKKDGMELICVVLMEESPTQFTDTRALFEYGFNNFTLESIKGKEFSFDSNKSGFFKTGTDIFGDSEDILMLNDNAKVVLPTNATFDDLKMNVVYDTDNVNAVAKAEYSYNGNVVGYADIMLNTQKTTLFEDSPQTISDEEVPYVSNKDGKSVFVNIKYILISLVVFVLVVSLAIIIYRKIVLAKREIKKKARNKSREKDRVYRDPSKRNNFKL